jgi:hypothetical protein
MMTWLHEVITNAPENIGVELQPNKKNWLTYTVLHVHMGNMHMKKQNWKTKIQPVGSVIPEQQNCTKSFTKSTIGS